MVFTFPRDADITGEVIQKFIDEHMLLVPEYLENDNMYKGYHAILDKEALPDYKPDNRLTANFAKYIVDISEGYIIGVPVKVVSDIDAVNETLNDFRNRANMSDVESEASKLASIFGHSFIYMYQDEEAYTQVVPNGPIDMFMVYDDTIAQKPLFAVRYFRDAEDEFRGELITDTHYYTLTEGKDTLVISDELPHYYNGVPVVEWMQNSERQSVFHNVKSLINALNLALSEKANDVSYFADSYLAVLGALIDEETMANLRANRTINIAGEGTDKVKIEFVTKPSADGLQENLIDRLIDLIYQLSMTANMNDEAFGGNISGVAMEFKLQGMKNMAIMKERKLQASMTEMYRMLFNLPTNISPALKDEWVNLEYQFSRNIPRNLQDEAETMAKMEGIVSKRTQLSVSSLIPDVSMELERIEEENVAPPMYDFQNEGE